MNTPKAYPTKDQRMEFARLMLDKFRTSTAPERATLTEYLESILEYSPDLTEATGAWIALYLIRNEAPSCATLH